MGDVNKVGSLSVTWDLVGPLVTVPFSYPAVYGHPVFTPVHISIEEARGCMTFSYLCILRIFSPAFTAIPPGTNKKKKEFFSTYFYLYGWVFCLHAYLGTMCVP